MLPLTLPAPQLSWKTGAAPELEQPVAIALPPLTYPDGAPLAPPEVQKLGVFIYRLAGGGEEIWNEDQLEWQPATTDLDALDALAPLAFVHQRTAPQPWQSVLVATGQKDKNDNDRYAKVAGGMPRYWLRAYASALRANQAYAGLGPASAELAFTSIEDGRRFELELEPMAIKQCERVRFRHRNAALQEAAWIELRSRGGQEVEIVACSNAGAPLTRIVLAANGDIELYPAPGRGVQLAGDLSVSGSLSTGGNVSVGGSLSVSSSVSVTGGLSASGNVSLGAGLTVGGLLDAQFVLYQPSLGGPRRYL